MLRARTSSRREGFTLVELLTVIGIISLLISILLPSLSRARDQAKKVAVQAQIDAMGKGLEMFHNDFNGYPDSAAGEDPIDWGTTWPATSTNPQPPNKGIMTGAHWMARALIGHDFNGVDNRGMMLKRGPLTPPPTLDNFLSSTTPPGPFSDRKGTYLDPQVFIRDDDPQKFASGPPMDARGPKMGRIIITDKYDFPVLYYRANPRARAPFGKSGNPAAGAGGGSYSDAGVYNQSDNAAFTGGTATWIDAEGVSNTETYPTGVYWDFAGSGSAHGLGDFGASNVDAYMTNLTLLDLSASATIGGLPCKGKSFINYFHSENTHQSGNAAKAQNPDTFVLISAGKDGVYGTDDDVSNSRGGGL